MDPNKIKQDFSIFKRKINGKPLVYLDNGATSLTPDIVVNAINNYYHNFNANIHRGVHTMGEDATIAYESAHDKVAKFINADNKEIIFTSGTTASLNILVRSIRLNPGDVIILTEMEHHSNIVPWLEAAKKEGYIIKYVKITENGELDMNHLKSLLLNSHVGVVSVTHMSNVLGSINNVKEIAKLAHEKGALCIVDGAQSVPHIPIDVKDIDCDFFCFSGHKMAGPTGIGVLYGKKELLNDMEPANFGGDMISEVHFDHATWNDLPWKFEAGTPNIAGGIGLGAAVEYLDSIGMDKIRDYEEFLTEYALTKLKGIEGVTIYGSSKKRGGVISFNVKDIHPHDVGTILDRDGIAIRGGHMCAMPLIKTVLKLNSVCRISLYFYNTTEDIDKLVTAIHKAKEVFCNDQS
ncbi:MAG: cysteine desulfurase [Nanoarchaeota archaeon]